MDLRLFVHAESSAAPVLDDPRCPERLFARSDRPQGGGPRSREPHAPGTERRPATDPEGRRRRGTSRSPSALSPSRPAPAQEVQDELRRLRAHHLGAHLSDGLGARSLRDTEKEERHAQRDAALAAGRQAQTAAQALRNVDQRLTVENSRLTAAAALTALRRLWRKPIPPARRSGRACARRHRGRPASSRSWRTWRTPSSSRSRPSFRRW